MNKAKLSGYIAVGSHLILFAFIFAWIAVLDPPQEWPRSILLPIALLPLAIPIRGLLDWRHGSFLASAFISLLYALHGGSEIYVDPSDFMLPLIELLLSLTILYTAVMHIRWSAQQQESGQP